MGQASNVLSEQQLVQLKEKLCHITDRYINKLCDELSGELLSILDDASIAMIDNCYHKLSIDSYNPITLEKKQESIVGALVREARGLFVSKNNTPKIISVLKNLDSIIKENSCPIEQLISKIGVCRELLASLYKNNLPAYQEIIACQNVLKTANNDEWSNFLTKISFIL